MDSTEMGNRKIYTLTMFSSLLTEQPSITFDGLDLLIGLKGYDNDDRYSECVIRFVKVIGFEYSLIGFGIVPESYDSIIEISDSDWLKRTEQYNKEKYDYYKPKHYALFLDDYGLYQVLANEVVISDGHRNEQ